VVSVTAAAARPFEGGSGSPCVQPVQQAVLGGASLCVCQNPDAGTHGTRDLGDIVRKRPLLLKQLGAGYQHREISATALQVRMQASVSDPFVASVRVDDPLVNKATRLYCWQPCGSQQTKSKFAKADEAKEHIDMSRGSLGLAPDLAHTPKGPTAECHPATSRCTFAVSPGECC